MPTDQIARELPCLCVTVKIRGPSFLEAPARSLTSLPAVDGPALPCAYDTTHGSDKRTVQTSLPCIVSRAHGKEISLPCVGP
jgi:hypothetical protein